MIYDDFKAYLNKSKMKSKNIYYYLKKKINNNLELKKLYDEYINDKDIDDDLKYEKAGFYINITTYDKDYNEQEVENNTYKFYIHMINKIEELSEEQKNELYKKYYCDILPLIKERGITNSSLLTRIKKNNIRFSNNKELLEKLEKENKDEELINDIKLVNEHNILRKKIIEQNLKFVVDVVKVIFTSRFGKTCYNGYSEMDAVCWGNIGLMDAISKYDINRNIKFTTYAYYWIKREINRSIRKDAMTIKAPNWVVELNTKIKKEIADFTIKNGREPKEEEICKKFNLELKKYRYITRMNNYLYSLDYMINSDNNDQSSDRFSPSSSTKVSDLTVYDEQSNKNADDNIRYNDDINDIKKLIEISNLTDNELFIIVFKYNLDPEIYGLRDKLIKIISDQNDNPYEVYNKLITDKKNKLETLGKILGTERENVRLRELKALQKLRAADNYLKNVNEKNLHIKYKGLSKEEFNRVMHGIVYINSKISELRVYRASITERLRNFGYTGPVEFSPKVLLGIIDYLNNVEIKKLGTVKDKKENMDNLLSNYYKLSLLVDKLLLHYSKLVYELVRRRIIKRLDKPNETIVLKTYDIAREALRNAIMKYYMLPNNERLPKIMEYVDKKTVEYLKLKEKRKTIK